MSEEELLARIAWYYYHDGLTQNEIGDLLRLPRLKISRLLDKGRQSGVIRVTINSRYEGCLSLEEQLQSCFNLTKVKVLPHAEPLPVANRLGHGASHLLMSLLAPQQILALGFGETTTQTLQHLSAFISAQQIALVTLSGGVGPYMTGIGQLDTNSAINMIPAPLRVSSAEVATIFNKEKSVNDIVLMACAADVAIVGIGAIEQKKQATMLSSGYMSETEQLLLERKGAVGDILGYFFDEQGSLIDDIAIHQELISVPLTSVAKIPTVIGIAGGVDKAKAIVAALSGKLINALVTDEHTALEVIKIIDN